MSKSLSASLEAGDFGAIVSASLDPMVYGNAEHFRRDYLAVNLLRKADYLPLQVDRRQVALDTFFEAEYICCTTNQYLRSPELRKNQFTSSVIFTARRKIERLLGTFCLDEWSNSIGFGPGATTSLKRQFGDVYFKLKNEKANVSPRARRYADVLREWAPNLGLYPPTDVPSNRVTTVPKSAKTDRLIAIEPDYNLLFQKGVGLMIRKRLRKAGLLLRDAQDRNRDLARAGSLDGSLCTIDLSMASDTLSKTLVQMLMPESWLKHMDNFRSEFSSVNGEPRILHKYSSMGNGFTFELETLIFWAIARSVIELCSIREKRCLVFGDDIIVSTDCYAPLTFVLSDLGFSVNQEKSFSAGPFRESCGGHYFLGVDVTPFYIKKRLTSPLINVLANAITTWSGRTSVFGLDDTLSHVHDRLTKIQKRSGWYCPIPLGMPEDSGIVVDFDVARPTLEGNFGGLRVWRVNYVRQQDYARPRSDRYVLARALWLGRLRDESQEPVGPYPSVSGNYRRSSTLVYQWPSVGSYESA
jgi:hypothetical protein